MADANNPPAFPHVTQSKRAGSDTIYMQVSEGMTLRDWFAGQALAGMGTWCPCRGDGFAPSGDDAIRRAKSDWAYAQADAMLAERKRG